MHGGALRLGKLGGIFAPGKRLFPKYYQGVYKKGKTEMVLSRGLGSLRLFNRPEIVVVNLFEDKKTDTDFSVSVFLFHYDTKMHKDQFSIQSAYFQSYSFLS
jgi:hypothetical protein